MPRIFGYLAVAALIGGCAALASGPEFRLEPVRPDKGMVYIYRPYAEYNRSGYPYVFVNDEKKFPLRLGYALLALPPGSYGIKIKGSGMEWGPPVATRTLGVEAGKEYFVRAIPVLPPGDPHAMRMSSMPESLPIEPGEVANPLLLDPEAGPHRTYNLSRTLVELVPKSQALSEIGKLRRIDE